MTKFENDHITQKQFAEELMRYKRGSVTRRHFLGVTGLGLATANYWALTQTFMPGALPVAIQNTAANLAGVVAPWLTGWLIKQTGSFDAPVKAVGFWLLLGIGCYAFVVKRKPDIKTA